MNTREREVMDALALAARRMLAWIDDRGMGCNAECGNPECKTKTLRSSVAAYDALLAEGSASSEGQITPGMIREAEGHLPLNLPKNDAYPRWQAMADFLNRAIVNPNEPCPCCNVTPAGDVLDHLPSPPSASSEEAEAEMHAFAEILAAAQKPFDPDVAKAIRDNWRKLFDDDTFSQPAQGEQFRMSQAAADAAHSIKVGEVLTQEQWDGVCAFVREQDGIIRAFREQRSCEGSELPALERYGIEWRGPHMPIALPMPDGYWTPWHIAEAALKEREHERRPIADWERQSMEFLAKKLHERGDELSEDSASWLEKFALESALPRGLPAGSDSCGQVVRNAARYLYLRDFPPRARAEKEGNTQPSLNDMWVSAFVNPTPGMIPTIDILEGDALDARIDAAIAAQQRQGGAP